MKFVPEVIKIQLSCKISQIKTSISPKKGQGKNEYLFVEISYQQKLEDRYEYNLS
jgi:hypothetical protein